MLDRRLSVKAQALKCLSMREYSRAQLRERLQRYWNEGRLKPLAPSQEFAQVLQDTLDELVQKNYLSEARAAEALIHRRAQQWGNAKLVQGLRSMGLSEETVQQALHPQKDQEWERAQAVWHKKFANSASEITANDPETRLKAKAKQARFLISRGFAPEVVQRVIQGAEKLGLGDL